ncbi:Stk1 family PASTA domain-containing Ser/Thr kinase [Spongiactinospora sp. TRM90649]|uniref:Stk1 family PASTA domain-containing Ser/Thr kinase n=1 Tax=Spongiactinospora sp. TRM90649 TaxID=3031114 RepID=UPI0023F6E120|nr:Stk1 family PASTA domain-containing Ser/Thr kinase [Spongiactinospora sp. TRM90649]MDF5752976.1 Stk1 family PASTA domain-containing Ser/Thr kinase [Spongiactinospora sp. TRM90649]
MTQPRLLGGRYELDGIVGRGGMAEVYRARDIRLDRVVAIKTLRSDLARDHTFQARFRREAQSAASLNHPSIIAVYDTGEDMMDGTPVPYIVMEYVDGRTLRDLLRADRRLLPERAGELVDGILRALDYSHRGGIVHRDIKPANVMITRAGDVKVMDFGIARAMADGASTMTQTAQVIGTAQYLSPEQARGERVDARSDVYSTGCVLYELLTGQPPFTGDSPVAIAYQHVREEPIPPSQIDREIPMWADTIVLKAMAKDPAHRYQSAGEMRAELQRAMSGMPVDAPQQTMAISAGDYGGRTMVAPGAGGPATQRTGAIPDYEYGEETRGGGRRRAAPKGNTALRTTLWILVPLLIIGAFIGVGWLYLSSPSDTPAATTVTIPDVSSQEAAAATKELTEAGLKVVKVTENSDEFDEGQVIGTDPPAGSQVATQSEVKLKVSKGVEKVKVPDVVNQSLEDAKTALEKAGFNTTVTAKAVNRAPDKVYQTDPKAGESVEKGSTVKLFVPMDRIEVPDLAGYTLAEAKRALTQAGFQVKTVEQPSADVPAGNVISTSPPAGSKLNPKTTVTILVSTGPEQPQQPTEEPTDDDVPPTDFPTVEPTDGEPFPEQDDPQGDF